MGKMRRYKDGPTQMRCWECNGPCYIKDRPAGEPPGKGVWCANCDTYEKYCKCEKQADPAERN